MNGYPTFYYDNRFTDATPVASGTAAGYDVLNLTDLRAYTWYKPDALPANVDVNCGTVKAANYCLVYGHDLGTQGATLEVRGSSDGFVANDNLVISKTPTDDKPFLLQFADTNYQHWRARITGTTVPSMAICLIGQAFAFPKRLRKGFDPLGTTLKLTTNQSAKGHPLGNIIEYEMWDAQLAFRNVSWTWLRDTFKPAWDAHLKSVPAIFAWDPTDHDDELYLVVTEGRYRAPHQDGQFADLSFDIAGVVP